MFPKISLKRCLIIFIIVFCFFICLFVLPIFFRNYKYSTDKDTHAAYGNGRFQIGIFGNPVHYALFDAKINTSLIYDIEKFYTKGKNVYFTGYFYSSHGTMKNNVDVWRSIDPQTREETQYMKIENIPKYSIFNYETGAVKLYKTLEEVPEKERKYFEKDKYYFYIWCYFRGVCFDKNRTY